MGCNHKLLVSALLRFRFILSDKSYLSLMYYAQTGRKINWDMPLRFTEKLQWLKLYYRIPILSRIVDKVEVKKFVTDLIGERYLIPTIGVWDSVDDIDWESLPNQFVLKTTQGGGSNGVFICRDKSSINQAEVSNKLKKACNTNIYKILGEWPYNNITPRIIAEPYMYDEGSPNKELTDYKFYCFNGKPKYCQVIRNRSSKETIDFYDMNWEHMPFIGLIDSSSDIAYGTTSVDKPKEFNDMIRISSILSSNYPFARIDLYLINDRVFFGEITFYPASGFGLFNPDEWDFKLGESLKLPKL